MAQAKNLSGLGGWLILVGIGVILAPIRLMWSTVPLYFSMLKNGIWNALTNPESDSYIQYFNLLFSAEFVVNSLLLIASIVAIYFFFTKHYLFPKLYITLLLGTLFFILIDSWLVSQMLGTHMLDSETTRELGRSLIACLIWVPYMLVSRRVKATFLKNEPNDNTGQSL